MPRISILPEQVANQIAAGEVIERPASIVKELLENSLDAGASRVEVEFKNGGVSYLRIEDDGCGMSQDDALLSLERHATSKIRAASDLDLLDSMGFRGEALPSIASVSYLSLQSRPAKAEAGVEVILNAGRLLHVKDCGMPIGTRIVVTRLFNSVPARRKFLKSVATESAHIVHQTRLYALARPEVAFHLIDDGRALFQSPACSCLRDRVGEIYGRQTASQLLEVDAEEDDLRLTGLIGRPGQSRSSRHEMLIFINNRPVENRALGYALIESYYGHIPRGRYPVAFLFLRLPSAQIDVNVHPAKREVRFRNEAKTRGFAVRTILDTLRRSLPGEIIPAKPTIPGAAPPARQPVLESATLPPVAKRASASPEKEGAGPAPKHPEVRTEPGNPRRSEVPSTPAPQPIARSDWDRWRFLGWTQGEYAVFDAPDGLAMLHARAAQERVSYELVRAQLDRQEVASQALLLPIPIEFDPVTAAIVVDHGDLFESCGLAISPFGRNFFRIEAVPSWLPESQSEIFVTEIAELLRKGAISDQQPSIALDEIARRAASKLSRGLGELNQVELAELLDRLFSTRNPLADPAGRPTFIEFGKGELARRFHRGSTGARQHSEDSF